MCTIGVLRLDDDDYLLFKNKDFVREHFDDVITVEKEVFGASGVTTWAGTDPDAERSGLHMLHAVRDNPEAVG